MSLMRTAFWLGLLIMVLPIEQDPADKAETPDVTAWQALGAAQAVYTDLSGFCGRNPAACETGEAAAKTFGNKAKASVKVIYNYLSDEDKASAGPMPARSAPARDAETREAASREAVSREAKPHTVKTQEILNRNVNIEDIIRADDARTHDTLTPQDRELTPPEAKPVSAGPAGQSA